MSKIIGCVMLFVMLFCSVGYALQEVEPLNIEQQIKMIVVLKTGTPDFASTETAAIWKNVKLTFPDGVCHAGTLVLDGKIKKFILITDTGRRFVLN